MARQATSAAEILEYPSTRKKRDVKRAEHMRLVRPTRRRSSAEIAAERVRALIFELADDIARERGWVNNVNAQLGLPKTVSWKLRNGQMRRLGLKLIDRICTRLDMPLSVLLDEE